MDRIRWTEKSITFRDLVDNPALQKPALVQIGTKSIVVGEKINGEFIVTSPCKVSNNRFDVIEQEIVLSSKYTGIWKVISKSTWKNEGYIHRLTTQHIERIYRQDVKNERKPPRIYVCTKDIEAFELHLRQNDSAILNGQRAERRKKHIEENVEFEITDMGEVEYTPTEGERTSQDYVMVPKNKPGPFLHLFKPGTQDIEQFIRNRVLRVLFCTTKSGPHQRRFLLEVNEQPCDIRPIASKGSTELRYLQSTQNLFDYMSTHENDTFLYVKLLRGDSPVKAIEFDGYMVFKSILNGDRIPICRVEDLKVTIVNPDLPIRVKLPTGDYTWRSIPEIHAAEVQCMQLNLSLLSKHESEMYVTVETEKNIPNYLQTNFNQEKRSSNVRRISDTNKTKHIEESEKIIDNQLPISKSQKDARSGQTKSIGNTSVDEKKISKQLTSKLTRPLPVSHPVSDKLYRDNEKRILQEQLKTERQRMEQGEKVKQTQRTRIREKLMTSSSSSFKNSRTKASNI